MDAPTVQTGLVSADHSSWPRPGAMAFGASPGTCVQSLVETPLRLMEQAADLVTQLPSRAPPSYPASQVALLLLVYCVAPKADHLPFSTQSFSTHSPKNLHGGEAARMPLVSSRRSALQCLLRFGGGPPSSVKAAGQSCVIAASGLLGCHGHLVGRSSRYVVFG